MTVNKLGSHRLKSQLGESILIKGGILSKPSWTIQDFSEMIFSVNFGSV